MRIALGSCLLMAACALVPGGGERSLAQDRQPLAGGPFILSDPGPNQSSLGRPQVACNAQEDCLIAWYQWGGIVARRTRHGTVLDAGYLRLSGTGTGVDVAVGAGEGEFLVAWPNESGGIVAVRVRASDGAILDDPPIEVGAGSRAEGVLFAEGRYLVCSTYGDGDVCARVEDGDVLDAEPIAIGATHEWWAESAYVRGPGSQVAIAVKGELFRLDLATGALSAASPFAKYTSQSASGLSFDGTNYIALFSQPPGGASRAARVRPSDGALLDPPDDIGQLPGGRQVFPVGGADYHLYDNGSNTAVMFDRGPPTGILVPSNLVRPGATENTGDFELPTGTARDFDASVVDDFGLLVTGDTTNATRTKVRAFVVTPHQDSAPTFQDGPTLSFGETHHALPGAGSDGHDFVVVYMDGPDVRSVRVDGATGLRVGPEEYYGNVGSFSRPPLVTWTGETYLAVWDSRYGLAIDACSGRGGLQFLAAAACGGTGCARLDGPSAPIKLTKAKRTTGEATGDAVIVNDDGVAATSVALAATNATTAASARFLAFWSTGVAVRYRVYDGDLNPVTDPKSLAAVTAAYPYVAAASDGTRFLLAWMDVTHVKTALVDAEGVAGQIVDRGVVDSDRFTLIHDGSAYLFARSVAAAPTLTRLDEDGASIGTDVAVPTTTLAAASFGRSLITSIEHEDAFNSDLVHGYFYDDPLSPGLSARGPSSCEPPNSTGGTGGTSGTSGTGGAGVTGGTGGIGGTSASGGASVGDAGATSEGGGAGETDPSRGGASPAAGGTGAGTTSTGGASSGGTSGNAPSAGTSGDGPTPSAGGTAGGGRPSNSGGRAGSAAAADAGTVASTAGSGHRAGSAGHDSGCGCRTTSSRANASAALIPLLGWFALRRRRRAERRGVSPRFISI